MEFREFVARSRQAHGTTVVSEAVECADIAYRVAQAERSRNRAVLFSNIVDRQACAVGNLFGSGLRVCDALKSRNYPQLFRRLEQAIETPVPVAYRASGGNDYVVTRDPDLARLLPATRYTQADATPYLTSGILMARYPGSDRRHVCFVRMAIVGENRLLINPGTPRIMRIAEETVGRGKELDVRILIGPPTELLLMACVTMPGEQDKLEVAQAIAGDHLGFYEDLLPVPCSTEYVLSGRVIPRYEREGPFGEVGGVYSVKERNPVCVIDEIRHREDPVFHSVSAGISREHLELVSLGARSFLERLRRATPAILRYDIPAFGADRLAVVTVKDGFDPRGLVEKLWEVPIIRGFVFVNADVAGKTASDLLWALLHRATNSSHFEFTEKRHPVYNTDKFFVDATVRDSSAWENRRVSVYGAARPKAPGGL